MPNVPFSVGPAKQQVADKPFKTLRDRMSERAAQTTKDSVMLLLDLSSSMSCPFRGFTDKLVASKTCANKYLDSCNPSTSAVGMITFATAVKLICEPVTFYDTLRFRINGLSTHGMTNMGAAIQMAIDIGTVTRCILISDGAPGDSWDAPVRQAKLGKKVIDCIYIGEPDEHGAKIMKEIAELTGGYFYTVDDMAKFEKAMRDLTYENRLLLSHESK